MICGKSSAGFKYRNPAPTGSGLVMGRFRLVLFQNPDTLEARYVEKVDFKEIEEKLKSESVVGVFIGKE